MRPALAALALAALLLQPPAAHAGPGDLAGRRIVLDPGHGGSDPGAVGLVQEAGVNLDVALRARDLLQAEGATVLLTRTCDCTVSLAARVALANDNGAHRFISIHSNACGGCGGTGTETYRHTSQGPGSTSGQLAAVVQDEMVQHLGLRDRGVKQADFYVLRNTAMPAVLVELGFVDTAADAAKLGSPAWRQEAARALLHAVQRHFGVAPHDPPAGDTAPPVTTASLAGTAGSAGWWRSAVTVTLAATDPGSGVARTLFRVDGGAWGTYAGPFPVAGEGGHAVQFHSVDHAGNVEAVRQANLAIDTAPPATGHALQGLAGDAGWWRSAVTVALAASDATSGVAATESSLGAYAGPFAVSGEGRHALAYRSRDVAGNAEPWRALALAIDTVPPATALQRSGPFHQGAQAYASAATRFTLAALDATSGVRGSTWSWRGAGQAYGGAFGLGGADGPGTLAWRSEDHAGNAEAWRSAALFLDTTPPQLSVEAPPPGALVASLEPVALGAEASDAGSGVARVEFLVDGVVRHVDHAPPYGWAWAAGDEALGEHVLAVRAVDHLGHAAVESREVTTVPTSPAGAVATAQRLQGWAAAPPPLPVLGVVAEADPAGGHARAGITIDGAFIGVEA